MRRTWLIGSGLVLCLSLCELLAQRPVILKIADTQSTIPLTPPLRDFTRPAISRGIVAFCVVGEGGYQGIFHTNARSFTRLADTETEVPGGGGGPFTNFSFGLDRICPSFDSLRGVFKGNSAGLNGIYLGFGGPDPAKVAARGDVSPGGEALLNLFARPSIDFDDDLGGQVVFQAYAAGKFPSLQPAIFSYPVGAAQTAEEARVVVRKGDPFPGRAGEFFADFTDPVVDDGTIAFRGFGTDGSSGIFLIPAGTSRLTTVAVDGTPVPRGEGNFTGFAGRFSSQVVATSDGNVAFRGDGSGGQQGIYAQIDGVLERIADLNTPVPGTEGNFTAFFDEPVSIDGENVAFVAVSRASAEGGGRTGLYVRMGGRLRRVVESGEMLDGRQIIALEIGPQALEGDFLTFRAIFRDGIAVYLAALELGDAAEGDLNNDGIVDFRDLSIILRAFGPCPPFSPVGSCREDLNGDGVVDSEDVLEVWARRGFVGVNGDSHLSPIEIEGGRVEFTTVGATTSQYPLPPISGGFYHALATPRLTCREGQGLDFYNDIWFRYRLREDCSIFTATTCGFTNFDTRLAVYAALYGESLVFNAPLQTLSCNDDTAGCRGGSRVYFYQFPNESLVLPDRIDEVLIRVGSRHPAMRGEGSLLVGCAVAVGRPTGNSPDRAIPLFWVDSRLQGDTFSDSVVSAQDDTPDCGEGDFIDEWWGFVAPCTGVISAEGETSIGQPLGAANLFTVAVFEGTTQKMLACNAETYREGTRGPFRVKTYWGAVTGNYYTIRLGAEDGIQDLNSFTQITIECLGVDSCGADFAPLCDQPGNGVPGCRDGFCCNQICEQDPYCCNIEWDIACAALAQQTCQLGNGGTQE